MAYNSCFFYIKRGIVYSPVSLCGSSLYLHNLGFFDLFLIVNNPSLSADMPIAKLVPEAPKVYGFRCQDDMDKC